MIEQFEIEKEALCKTPLTDLQHEAIDVVNDIIHNTKFRNAKASTRIQAVKYLKLLLEHTPLTPITLNDNEFIPDKNIPGILIHKRCDYICKKEGDNRIFNGLAYGYTVKHTYDYDTNEEIETFNDRCDAFFPLNLAYTDEYLHPFKLYITKGGIIKGEYIDLCYIKESATVDISKPINLPINIIDNTRDGMWLTVDYKSPELKELMNIYDCPINKDDTYFNIRRCKKLK